MAPSFTSREFVGIIPNGHAIKRRGQLSLSPRRTPFCDSPKNSSRNMLGMEQYDSPNLVETDHIAAPLGPGVSSSASIGAPSSRNDRSTLNWPRSPIGLWLSPL